MSTLSLAERLAESLTPILRSIPEIKEITMTDGSRLKRTPTGSFVPVSQEPLVERLPGGEVRYLEVRGTHDVIREE